MSVLLVAATAGEVGPLMTRLGHPATVRASFHLFTDQADIDRLVEGLHDVRRVMGV